MELDLLQKEQVVQESSHDSKELCQLPFVASNKLFLKLADSTL